MNRLNKRDNSKLKNCSFEDGTSRYIPEWTTKPYDAFSHNTSKSISGYAALKIAGGSYPQKLIAETVTCSENKQHGLLFYVLAEGNASEKIFNAINFNFSQKNETK